MEVSKKIMDLWNIMLASLVPRRPTACHYMQNDQKLDAMPHSW